VPADFSDDRVVAEGKPDPDGGKATRTRINYGLGGLQVWQQGWHDLADLRFLRPVETFHSGTPPARILNYYSHEGTPIAEEVTVNVLRLAALRLMDGAFDGRSPGGRL
jgi:hypothetical protein